MYQNKPTRKPGESLYTFPSHTIPEAAGALGIAPYTLYSWYSKRQPLLTPTAWYGEENHIALLSFRDLEEAYKLHLLRTKYGQTMQYLVKALPDARIKSASEHPLVDCKLHVFKYLVLEQPGRGRGSRRAFPLGFSDTKSQLIPEVVDTWGRRIVADAQGRTVRIHPWRHAQNDDNSRPVSIDPEVLSGRLVVTGTRIPVRVLSKRNIDGESAEEIAKDYGIDPEVVVKALIHFDQQEQSPVHTVS